MRNASNRIHNFLNPFTAENMGYTLFFSFFHQLSTECTVPYLYYWERYCLGYFYLRRDG